MKPRSLDQVKPRSLDQVKTKFGKTMFSWTVHYGVMDGSSRHGRKHNFCIDLIDSPSGRGSTVQLGLAYGWSDHLCTHG